MAARREEHRGRCGTRTIDSRIEGQGHPPRNGESPRCQGQRPPEEGRDHRQDPRHDRIRPSSAPPAAAEPSAPAEAGGSPRRDHVPSNGDSPNRDAAGGASSVDTSSNGDASRDITSSADADSPHTDDDASSDLIATPVGTTAPGADVVVLGADGEPLADWEIALLAEGGSADGDAPGDAGSTQTDQRQQPTRNDAPRQNGRTVTLRTVTARTGIGVTATATATTAVRTRTAKAARTATMAASPAPRTAMGTVAVAVAARVVRARKVRRAKTPSSSSPRT